MVQRLWLVGEIFASALQQRREEERARQLSDQLARMGRVAIVGERAAAIAHEINQPLTYVVAGRLNKQIARRHGISEKTVKVHRGQVMRKTHAGSLVELVWMAEKAGIEGPLDPC